MSVPKTTCLFETWARSSSLAYHCVKPRAIQTHRGHCLGNLDHEPIPSRPTSHSHHWNGLSGVHGQPGQTKSTVEQRPNPPRRGVVQCRRISGEVIARFPSAEWMPALPPLSRKGTLYVLYLREIRSKPRHTRYQWGLNGLDRKREGGEICRECRTAVEDVMYSITKANVGQNGCRKSA